MRQVERLTEDNSLLTAAEAEWLMKEKMLDDRIRELQRQLDDLNTAVCCTPSVVVLQLKRKKVTFSHTRY